MVVAQIVSATACYACRIPRGQFHYAVPLANSAEFTGAIACFYCVSPMRRFRMCPFLFVVVSLNDTFDNAAWQPQLSRPGELYYRSAPPGAQGQERDKVVFLIAVVVS